MKKTILGTATCAIAALALCLTGCSKNEDSCCSSSCKDGAQTKCCQGDSAKCCDKSEAKTDNQSTNGY